MTKLFLLSILLLELTACSPLYVVQAAYQQSKILLRREKITDLIENPDVPAEKKEKLRLVLEARDFAVHIGLDPKNSFTRFSEIKKDELIWLLMGSKKDSFELRTWWFPIVGSVPYKGFFSKEDGDKNAEYLISDGYEIWLRPSAAYSTLGWFSDPVPSTVLDQNEVYIADTILHESLHSTIWIKNYVDFNESLANFIGNEAAIYFFEERLRKCASDNIPCQTENLRFVESSKLQKRQQMRLALIINDLFQSLDSLYKSQQSSAQKISQREIIFNDYMAGIKTEYPDLKILKSINNAEIMQLKIYMTELELFEKLFNKCHSNFKEMVEAIRTLKDELAGSENPFRKLSEKIEKNEVCRLN